MLKDPVWLQLKGLKIYYRESMKKVSADDVLRDFSTVNSLAILNTRHVDFFC
jgi:hypothetical protein